MKPLTNYLKNNNVFNNIDESLNNNVRMINESQLIIEHGKDIDNLLHKFGSYTYNSLYNPVNESSFNYKLTLNESITARDFFIFICEDYKEALLEELNIYEQYINDALEINEDFKNSKVYQNVVAVLKQGKEKTLQAYDNVKTKIKEVNQIIKDFANKTIKSVKEMANRLMELLEKFNCTIKQLFEKMGFNIKDEEIDAIGQDLAKNPDTIKGNDIYDFKSETVNESFEAYGQQLINEDKENGETVDQVEYKGGLTGKKKLKDGQVLGINVKAKTKEMLWSGFRQFLIWASVCVIIPGIVCAVFPGTFIALLVPLACKLGWSLYKIWKIRDQWLKAKKEWNNYKKWQKFLTVFGMVASIIAVCFNIGNLYSDGSEIISAFTKTGCKILEKANLGIEPDILTKGFAAFTRGLPDFIKNLFGGKFSLDDFGKAFEEITNSFAEKTDLGAGVGAAIEKTIKGSGKLGQTAKEAAEKIKEINDATHGSSMAELKAIEKISIGVDKIKDAPDNTMVDLVVNGTKESSYGKHLINFLKKTGIDTSTNDLLNKSLQKLNKLAGSVYTIRVPKDEALEILNNSAKYAKDGFIYAVSATAEEVTNNIPEIIDAASSMVMTIPSVEYAFKNNGGFRVRLGTDKKKFIYEVGKDDVKKEKASDHVKELEKITNIIEETNNEYHKKLQNELKDADENKKKEIEDKLKIFKSNFKKINTEKDSKVIIFYGKQKQNESLKSLHDYILFESEEKKTKYSIDDIKDNFKDLRDYLNKIRYDKEQKGGGNNYMLITSIFNTNPNKPTSKFKFNKDYPDEPGKPYELIKKRATDKDETNDVFGPNDIELLAKNFDEWIGSGNGKAYGYLTSAFIDALALRTQFMNNKDEDTIIAEYSEMVNNLLKIKYINDDVKDKKWIRGEQWAPLKFDEDQIDDEIVQKVNDTEKNSGVEPSKDEAEKKLEKTEAPITQDTNDSNEESNKKEESNDKGEKPILMIAYNYVIDLSDSDNNGPRKDIFTLKGISDNYEFIEIKGGTSKENISIMLGDILNKQTKYLTAFTILNPCDDEDSDKFKTIGDDNFKRKEFGNLTNGEITDILNDPKSAKNYIFNGSSNSIAQNDNEKKQEEEFKKEYNDKLKNADEDTIKAVKEIDPDAVGDDGKIKEENMKKLSQDLATIKLGQDKANKGGGIMSWLKNMFRKIFPNKKKNEKLKKLKEILDNKDIKKDNNNLNKYDDLNIFFKEVFSSKSLSEYIMERKL